MTPICIACRALITTHLQGCYIGRAQMNENALIRAALKRTD